MTRALFITRRLALCIAIASLTLLPLAIQLLAYLRTGT